MAFATKPKPTVTHKKRQAKHHRHSKSYLGTYWPYLPVFAVLVSGAITNKLWSSGALSGVTGNQQTPSTLAADGLTRIQVLAGSQASTALLIVVASSTTALAVFMFRNWRHLRQLLSKGETFAYEHAWIDVVTVFVFTVGFLLTRPNGPLR